MGLRVGEGEGAAPGAAEDLPGVDRQRRPQPLDVLDQFLGRVLLDRRVRRALAGAALVEEDDAVPRRVEEAPIRRVDTSAGPAVEEDGRLACRVADLFVVELVQVGDAETAAPKRLDRRIEVLVAVLVLVVHCILLPKRPATINLA